MIIMPFLTVLDRQGYWKGYVFGKDTSPGSYTLISSVSCIGLSLEWRKFS